MSGLFVAGEIVRAHGAIGKNWHQRDQRVIRLKRVMSVERGFRLLWSLRDILPLCNSSFYEVLPPFLEFQ